MGYLVLLGIAILLGFFLFHPALKGWRTQILGGITAFGGGLLPLVSQITDYLQTLDWRQYVLNFSDRKNLLVIAIPGVLGLLIIILRWMTTGPVGTKQ